MRALYHFIFFLGLFVFLINNNYGQNNVGIGISTPDPSAALDVFGADKGFLAPRVADTNAISSPADGLMIYFTPDSVYLYWDGVKWMRMNGASGGNGSGVTSIDAGFGLSSNASTGDIVIDAEAGNGLNVDALADEIRLGGSLEENTTIALGTYDLVHNMSGTGNFEVRDAGNPALFVGNDGLIGISTNSPNYELEVSGTTSTTNFQMTTGATDGYIMQSDALGNGSWVDASSITGGGNVSIDPGAGLDSTMAGGVVTLNASVHNGLKIDLLQDKIELGGTLTENTTIAMNNYKMIFNMTGNGDFEVRDNGNAVLFVKDDATVGVGTNNPLNKLHINDSNDPVRIDGLATDNSLTDVLTVDNQGVVHKSDIGVITPVQAHICKLARGLTSQTIPNNTWTKIDFDQEEIDRGNLSDISNGKIVIARDGFYQVSASMKSHIIDEFQYIAIQVRVNGTWAMEAKSFTGDTPGYTETVSVAANDVLSLSAGDEIELYVEHKHSSSMITSSFTSGKPKLSVVEIP